MKIINNTKSTAIIYNTLNSGDVFEWNGDFYLFLESGESALLEDGTIERFPKDCVVHPVEATLTIS